MLQNPNPNLKSALVLRSSLSKTPTATCDQLLHLQSRHTTSSSLSSSSIKQLRHDNPVRSIKSLATCNESDR
jgi:hypothetical protein